MLPFILSESVFEFILTFFFSFFSFLITKGRSENVLFHITNVFGFYSNGILRFLFSRENETEAIACIF